MTYTTLESFLADWKDESDKTRAILRALDDRSLGQAVAKDHRTLARLAWHLATSNVEMLKLAGLPLETLAPDAPVPATAAAIAAGYDVSAREIGDAVRENWKDATLAAEDDMYGERWKKGFTLGVLVLHQAHHRGQMTVLMRQAGLAVPGIYGPSRDEWPTYGMTAPAV